MALVSQLIWPSSGRHRPSAAGSSSWQHLLLLPKNFCYSPLYTHTTLRAKRKSWQNTLRFLHPIFEQEKLGKSGQFLPFIPGGRQQQQPNLGRLCNDFFIVLADLTFCTLLHIFRQLFQNLFFFFSISSFSSSRWMMHLIKTATQWAQTHQSGGCACRIVNSFPHWTRVVSKGENFETLQKLRPLCPRRRRRFDPLLEPKFIRKDLKRVIKNSAKICKVIKIPFSLSAYFRKFKRNNFLRSSSRITTWMEY